MDFGEGKKIIDMKLLSFFICCYEIIMTLKLLQYSIALINLLHDHYTWHRLIY